MGQVITILLGLLFGPMYTPTPYKIYLQQTPPVPSQTDISIRMEAGFRCGTSQLRSSRERLLLCYAGLHPCTAGRSYRRKRPPPQIPRSILSMKSLRGELLGEAHWNRPPWPGTTVTICMSCFMTGDPDKEYGTNKPPPTGRVRERLKGDTCVSIHFPESVSLASILAEWCVRHQERLWIRMIGQRPPRN